MYRRCLALLMMAVSLATLNSCSNISARAVESGAMDYNIALQRTDDRQMLLNLVRLRYRDRPYFLEAGSLTTQFSITSSLGLTGGAGTSIKQNTIANVGVGVKEQPTVSYQPLQGEEFAQRMLSPIDIQTIVLLANSGWSVERILRLTVQRMNGLPNAPTAAGPTPATAPEYHDFQRVTEALRQLQQRDQLHLYMDGRDEQAYLLIASQAKSTETFQVLANLLRLDPDSPRYRLMLGSTAKPGQSISLRLRSLMGVMSFMSQAVNVPESDKSAGLVTTTLNSEGEEFNWDNVAGSLFSIASQPQPPDSSAIAVQYRNNWFYIDDRDLDSKSSFSLLGQLFALRVGKGGGAAPMITLPVGN